LLYKDPASDLWNSECILFKGKSQQGQISCLYVALSELAYLLPHNKWHMCNSNNFCAFTKYL